MIFQNRKRNSGSSAVELVAGIIVLIPVFFFILDVGVCIMAAMTNDTICREAARAAAGGRPENFSNGSGAALNKDSLDRAKQLVKNSKTGGYISKLKLIEENSHTYWTGEKDPSVPRPDKQGGGPWGGQYWVTTEVVVSLPASVPNILPSSCTFQSRQAFPMTKVESPQFF